MLMVTGWRIGMMRTNSKVAKIANFCIIKSLQIL
jgi:hypothetical protein